MSEQLKEKIVESRDTLIAASRGEHTSYAEYTALRKGLMEEPALKGLTPAFLEECNDLQEFKTFMAQYSTYAQRRQFIDDEFQPLLSWLEGEDQNPNAEVLARILNRLKSAKLRMAWRKAFDRAEHDPDGAITAARSYLESVCKAILDSLGVDYKDNQDLPALYRLVAKNLGLVADKKTDESLKRVFADCQDVVNQLSNIRNRSGDAHGKGGSAISPDPYLAQFAVNLAGSVATLLIASSVAISESKGK